MMTLKQTSGEHRGEGKSLASYRESNSASQDSYVVNSNLEVYSFLEFKTFLFMSTMICSLKPARQIVSEM